MRSMRPLLSVSSVQLATIGMMNSQLVLFPLSTQLEPAVMEMIALLQDTAAKLTVAEVALMDHCCPEPSFVRVTIVALLPPFTEKLPVMVWVCPCWKLIVAPPVTHVKVFQVLLPSIVTTAEVGANMTLPEPGRNAPVPTALFQRLPFMLIVKAPALKIPLVIVKELVTVISEARETVLAP